MQLLLGQDFDLIVLGLDLPDIDGMEVLRILRSRRVTLPILILTARNGVKDMIEGINKGEDDFLNKPFEVQLTSNR